MRHLLSIRDLTAADLQSILAVSEQPAPRVLQDKGVALYFEKPSARTRNSMEMAAAQLGGHPVYLQPNELGIGARETVADVTHTLACYHAIIAARVFDHALLEQMAAVNAAPGLNMLSATDHPLQAFADLLTVKQLVGRLEGVRVAFIGEGNNVSRSLAEACALVGAEFVIASSARPRLGLLRSTIPPKPLKARTSSTATCGFRWAARTATNAAPRSSRTRSTKRSWHVRPNAWFLHCLPARRGEEVTAPVIDGPRSAIWRQAENRMHTARGAMLWMMGATA